MVLFENGEKGMILNLETSVVKAFARILSTIMYIFHADFLIHIVQMWSKNYALYTAPVYVLATLTICRDGQEIVNVESFYSYTSKQWLCKKK